jgi:lipid-A-disaccharide synthase
MFLKKVKTLKPDAVILVDYPGFNLRLAKKLKKMNVKVIYYISPQVWAWKEKRVELIKKYTDKMLVLFRFEKDFYTKHGIDVDFVGHPLLDSVKVTTTKRTLFYSLGFSEHKLSIGILPGSRQREIDLLLPKMLQAAEILYKKHTNMQFLILKASTININELYKHLEGKKLPVKIIGDLKTYDGLNACDVCMVASGTATLETAILNKPMVVVYETSLVTWWLAKLFIKIPYIGLVNVVAGKKVVPECIQYDAGPERIAQELHDIYINELRIAEIKSELIKVKQALGEPGASERAASKILECL